MPGAFKLDHLQPVRPILFSKFSNLYSFIFSLAAGEGKFKLRVWAAQRPSGHRESSHFSVRGEIYYEASYIFTPPYPLSPSVALLQGAAVIILECLFLMKRLYGFHLLATSGRLGEFTQRIIDK